MRKRPLTAIIVSTALVLSAPVSVMPSLAATPALSQTSMRVRVGASKVLKMKNTKQTVKWSVSAGKNRISLKKKKKTKVTIRGVKIGKAVVKAVIGSKSYFCKVTVKKAPVPGSWRCPVCGTVNPPEAMECTLCKEPKPEYLVSPSPSAYPTAAQETVSPPTYSPPFSTSPAPTVPAVLPTATTSGSAATAVPTVTPTINPDQLSSRYVWMTVNRQIPIIVQIYANNSATEFYNRINSSSAGAQKTFSMSTVGDNEFADYLTTAIPVYASRNYQVSAGELFLYDKVTLKLSSADHTSIAYPTRIGKVRSEDLSTLTYALSYRIDGKTWLEFAPYKSL